MNIRQIRDLALKILGIYYLSSALVRAPQFASIFFSWNKSPEMAGHGLAISLSVLLPFRVWAGCGGQPFTINFTSGEELCDFFGHGKTSAS